MNTKKLSEEIENNSNDLLEETLHCIKGDTTNNEFLIDEDRNIKDIEYIFNYLVEAVYFDDINLFIDFAIWLNSLFENRGLSEEVFKNIFNCIQEILQENFESEKVVYLKNILEKSIEKTLQKKKTEMSYITKDNPHKDFAEKYLELLLDNKKTKASNLILKEALDEMSIAEIYLNILQPVQKEVGRLWHVNKITVAQEHYISSVTQLVISQLYSHFLTSGGEKGTIVTTAVGTELHEIGIRMVADLLEIDGFDTIHLGANTPNSSIVETLKKNGAILVGVSVTLPIHLKELEQLVDMIRSDSELADLKILVGGYVFNQNPELKEDFDVDAYSENAQDAVKKANELTGGV